MSKPKENAPLTSKKIYVQNILKRIFDNRYDYDDLSDIVERYAYVDKNRIFPVKKLNSLQTLESKELRTPQEEFELQNLLKLKAKFDKEKSWFEQDMKIIYKAMFRYMDLIIVDSVNNPIYAEQVYRLYKIAGIPGSYTLSAVDEKEYDKKVTFYESNLFYANAKQRATHLQGIARNSFGKNILTTPVTAKTSKVKSLK